MRMEVSLAVEQRVRARPFSAAGLRARFQKVQQWIFRVASLRVTCQIMRGIEQRMRLALLCGPVLQVVPQRIDPSRRHVRVRPQVKRRVEHFPQRALFHDLAYT